METEEARGGRIAFFLASLVAAAIVHPVSSFEFRQVWPAFVAAVALSAATKGREAFVLSSLLATGVLLAILVSAGMGVTGIGIAAIAGISLVSRSSAGIVTQRYATLFVVAVALVLRFVPLSAISTGSVAVLPAAVLLLWIVSHEGNVRVPVLALTTFFTLVAPEEGMRAIVMSWVAVLVVLLLRFPNVYASGLTIAMSAVSLPWGPVVAAASLFRSFRGAKDAPLSFAIPFAATAPIVSWSAWIPFLPELISWRGRNLAVMVFLTLVAAVAPLGISSLSLGIAISALLLAKKEEDVPLVSWLPVLWLLTILARFFESGALATLILPRLDAATWAGAVVSAVAIAFAARFSRRVAAILAGTALVVLLMTGERTSTLFVPVDRSLARAERTEIQIDADLREIDLIVAGARVSASSRSLVLGHVSWIDGAGRGARRIVRVADAPDWGAFRSAERFATTNRLPFTARARIEGLGATSFVAGEGRIRLHADAPIRRLRIEASPSLPDGSRLHVVGFEAVK